MLKRLYGTRLTFILLCITASLFLYGGNQYLKIEQLQRDLVKASNMKYIQYNVSEKEEGVEYRVDQNQSRRMPSFCYTQTGVFQSPDEAEFPSSNNNSPKIPHKIHQICDSENILDVFVEPMQSFVANNPAWEYWFWTYDSGRKMLQDKYTYLVDIFDKFGNDKAKKSDLLRFAVIHTFGGVYADLDVRNLRSLDKATIKYTCIIPTEPFEHSSFLYDAHVILSTAVLLCQPEHPFFTQLLYNLQVSDLDKDPVTATGPSYVTSIYKLYNNLTDSLLTKTKTDNSTNSPYFYKGASPEGDDGAVYIPNSQYFMDDVDPLLIEKDNFVKCEVTTGGKFHELIYLDNLKQRGCNEFECRRAIRKSRKFTFTVHHWFHMWIMPDIQLKSLKKVHISGIFQNYNSY